MWVVRGAQRSCGLQIGQRARRFLLFYDGCEGSSASRLRSVGRRLVGLLAPHLGRVLVSHWTLAQPASTRTTNPHGELDKNPGVNQAIAAVDGAAPTPPGTARTFSRFTAITARSRLTQIRPPLATSSGVCTTTTRRPFAAGFDTRPWSSTVAPTANGSAGATLKMRGMYGQSLYRDSSATIDDLREAVTRLEDTTRIARRVLGGANPLTKAFERHLQKAQDALRARETPSPGGGA